MKTKFGLLGVGIVIGLALILVGWRFLSGPYKYKGSVIDPPVKAAEINLVDQNGKPFQLSDLKGKAVMVFFGYTHCPDVCPITIAQFKQIKADLGAQADNVRFVLITVDPTRDTPDVMRNYLANFDPSFIGLTGSEEQMTPVWKDYGVYQAASKNGSAPDDYFVDHSSVIYVIDQKGQWRMTYSYGSDIQAIEDDLQHLLKES